MKTRLLIVEDEVQAASAIRSALADQFDVSVVTSRSDALRVLADFAVVIADVRLGAPGNEDGLELVTDVKRRGLTTPVILITQHGDIEKAVRAIKEGAYDFLEKPVPLRRLEVLIQKAIRESQLRTENSYLRAELAERTKFECLIGDSTKMTRIRQLIAGVAQAPQTTVLITGERGTGKNVVARAIHDQSARSAGPFTKVTCSAITEPLAETELFGVIGNYPGFQRKEPHIGRLDAAKGGTLFLDEIGDMILVLQAKILDVLQSKRFTRVGEINSRALDARIVAATNKNLRESVRTGAFRADLFDRLNVVSIELPPLRDRKDDIFQLVDHFVRQFNEEHNRSVRGVDDEVRSLFMTYDWPNNVRGLQTTIENAFILSSIDNATCLGVQHFPQIVSEPTSQLSPLEEELIREMVAELDSAKRTLNDIPLDYQERLLRILLAREHGSGARVAQIVGVTPGALRRKLSDWHISSRSFKS